VSSEKKPRVRSVESSSDSGSDVPPTKAEKHSKSRGGLSEKIKKTWKDVKEKISNKSSQSPNTKKSTPFEFKAYDPSLSYEQKIELWKENGRNLFGNIKTLVPDFKKSQDVITDLMVRYGENFAADKFNAADYAGLGFDFSSTMSNDTLMNPMRFFTSKSVITSTKTTADEFLANSDEEFLAGSEDAPPLSSDTLNKPIRLCASGIGPALFRTQLLDILREIPLTCPVILDVSSNELGPDEVLEMVSLMKEHPVIYSLDLGNNPICRDKKGNSALIQLFGALGPVSRLFLDNTGFNDDTAYFAELPVESNCCLRYLSLQNNHLAEDGVITIIKAAIPSDFAVRAMTDSALTTVALQRNDHGSSDAIADALGIAFSNVYGDDLDEAPALAPMSLGIDLTPSLLQEFEKFEPHFSQFTSPRGNSTDERL
jgi:hypothetical protein